MKKIGFLFLIFFFGQSANPQQENCILQAPQFTVHFGTGNVSDPNISALSNYRRVRHSCPNDGYYSFASYTIECFQDDWHTLYEDHTPGDINGNMLLINAAWDPGEFLKTHIRGLKSNTTYEIGFWLMNLCKPTKKCPSVLLPNLSIRLETPEGKIVANIVTGDLPRVREPKWVQHRAMFTTPSASSVLILTMIDNVPSGCGNDFALDDITFRECVKQEPKVTGTPKPTVQKKQENTPKTAQQKVTPTQKKAVEKASVVKSASDTSLKSTPVLRSVHKVMPPPPLVLKTRVNTLARKIETEAGEIRIDIYDNGQIDGDTVSIYHNNALIRSHQRLSRQPITFTITVDPGQPHHELIMVAENLGSIPPNTSIMIITTPRRRYEVFISSSEQKNAKVVFDLIQ